MTVFRTILATLAVSAVAMTGTAHAVLVGGTYDVDPNLGVASFSSTSGSFSTNSHPNNDLGALSNNWGGIFGGDSAAQRRLNFLGSNPGAGNANVTATAVFQNAIFNNPGIDIIAFEQGDVPTDGSNNPVAANDPTNDEVELLSASLTGAAGTFVDFTVLDFLTSSQVGGTSTTFGVYVFGIDLDSLGVASQTSISSLTFGNSSGFLDHDPDIVWGGGVTGAAVAVPEASAMLSLALVGLVSLGGPKLWKRLRS